MVGRLACTVFVCTAFGCASPADMAKAQLGRSRCADQAEQRCEEDLASADRLACLKRETYLCEELERTPRP
jgi:hypothetical protein